MMPFLFAFCVSGALHSGYAWTLAFLLIVVGLPVFRHREIFLNFLLQPGFWLLAAFGTAYVVFSGFDFEDIQNYLLLPLAAFATGWCSFEQAGKEQNALRDCILGIALGFGLHGGLNCMVNFGHSRYQLVDFWSGNLHGATGSGFLNTMVFSLAVYTLFLEKRRWVKGLLMAVTAVCVVYALMLGTRTQFVILAVVSIFAAAALTKERRKPRPLMALLGIGLVLAVCYYTDALGFQSFLENSNLMARLEDPENLNISNSQRLAQFFAGLRGLYQHPMGGSKDQLYYHNMWLDISRVSGLVPMMLMTAYTGLTLVHGIRLIRDKGVQEQVRYVLACVYAAVLMNFFVEPILEGYLHFYLAFCAVNGMTEALYHHRHSPVRQTERRIP